MNCRRIAIRNKCSTYMDNLIRKPFVGKFLRVFCLYLSYLQLNLYGVSTAYYVFEIIGTQSLLPHEFRNVSHKPIAMNYDLAVNYNRFNIWANFMGLEFSLIGLFSVGAMMHGVKTLQKDLMLPWIVFHILFGYLNFLRENIIAMVNTSFSKTTAFFCVLKLVFFILIVLTVCGYYWKIYLDHEVKQDDKKKDPPLKDVPVPRRCLKVKM